MVGARLFSVVSALLTSSLACTAIVGDIEIDQRTSAESTGSGEPRCDESGGCDNCIDCALDNDCSAQWDACVGAGLDCSTSETCAAGCAGILDCLAICDELDACLACACPASCGPCG